MAVLIRRDRLVEFLISEEIIIDAPTVTDGIRILKSTSQDKVNSTFQVNELDIKFVQNGSSFINPDKCKIVPTQTKLNV